ncbi:FadR/GntR family transcriptional regulator [Tabrizicola fusiformis]|uniref:FadR/GntR family transcriptional regulator n=1 Tax=Tabrizicola sp. SY72 TaxID=2741673 RepID=UPI00157485C3|nr:FadR/GntR family transcriptional regulator [Tabrizicola sp. SY72]NTT87858.1 FadR family transcriptional regulator [Tabrizicola sp. SY72]
MTMPKSLDATLQPTPPQGQTLVAQVREAIRTQISKGSYKPGDRLPSEARLTQEFGVSRTVIREAVAALQSEKLVEPRQGAGVFVLEPPSGEGLAFRNLDLARVSSLIEMLELRTAVEGDAAGFAALRRSPAQEEKIIEAFDDLRARMRSGQSTTEADFRFHLTIAEAANSPRFPEFLKLIGTAIIPRHAIDSEGERLVSAEYLAVLDREHEEILAAILANDEDAARAAMRLHLRNAQHRYRQYLRALRR